MTPSDGSFTGRARSRKTSLGTKLADKLSEIVITVGGIGTIIAVLLVGLFLFLVVAPLFSKAEVEDPMALPRPADLAQPVYAAVDDFKSIGVLVDDTGLATVIRMENGEVLSEQNILEDTEVKPTAWYFNPAGEEMAIGLSDGTVQVGAFAFISRFLTGEEVPDGFGDMEPGDIRPFGQGVVEMTKQEQLRVQELYFSVEDPVDVGLDEPVTHLDFVAGALGEKLVVMDEGGQVQLATIRRITNMLTGVETLRSRKHALPDVADASSVVFVGLDALGANVYFAMADGTLKRVYTQDTKAITVAETVNLLEDKAGQRVTAVTFAPGRDTLITGDDTGGLRAWFTVLDEEKVGDTPDGRLLKATHDFGVQGSEVVSIGTSGRSRMITVGYGDGEVHLYFVTSEQQLAKTRVEEGQQVSLIAMSPKEDGLLAVSSSGITRWDIDPKHPAASLGSLFTRIWYVTETKPVHKWQSTSGSDADEPKLGMIPLIFGTLKATIYALSFAVPIAILAAIYTSQFMQPKLKAQVKPLIEMMASLPSVVLGFLAGLVIAPIVEDVVPALLAAVVMLPLALIAGAFIWQMLPNGVLIRIEKFRILPILLVALPVGLAMGIIMGPVLENIFFAGNIKQWLAFDPSNPEDALPGQAELYGSALGGWVLFLFPMMAIVVGIAFARLVNPWFREASGNWSRGLATKLNLLKLVVGLCVTVVITLVLGSALSGIGFDLRGEMLIWGINLSPADTYVQRNALIVGFAMGFAVIPIIFTIADDAMSAVPAHLLSASLGAGATPWQTAIRVVIPTAMSGIFSACMIGLGRAVGETMIVLMAAGNTPILDLNIFEGFRTLSANIATELPEAAKDSTHYRTLFLSALVLFILTFFVNTLAEIVRQRFRKRAVNL